MANQAENKRKAAVQEDTVSIHDSPNQRQLRNPYLCNADEIMMFFWEQFFKHFSQNALN